MAERLRQSLPVVIGLVLFLVALEVLRLELHSVSWQDLTADVLSTSSPRLAVAVVLTALNYLTLTGYDQLAFAYIGKSIPRRQIAAVSFVAYAVSNNVGFAMLSGASVRYRFYTRWGVSAEELSRVVFSYSVTFWLGLLALGGLSLALSPLAAIPGLPAPAVIRTIGWLLVAVAPLYLVATLLRRGPLRLWSYEMPLPPFRIGLGQVAVSAVEWALAGGVLYVLLPPSAISFVQFLGFFLVAILLGMASHVPGGVGVFEGLMVLLLKPYLPSEELLPPLVVFRAVYYALPLILALVGLTADEVWQRRTHLQRAGEAIGAWTERLTPIVLSLFTFVAGAVLLVSSATPAAPGRLALVYSVLPLGVIETSHFLGSVVGVALLVLSQGVARRLDAAYYLTSVTMVAGMITALLKGFDYEEAAFLAAVLLVLQRARPAFDRRAAFFDTRFSAAWIAALVGALGASVWLGVFAFKHVEYSTELWWQFELQGEVSRFLRASVGAAVTLLVVALARLTTYAPHEIDPPTAQDIEDAARIIARQGRTSPFLVYLRDKALLFDDAKSAFIMYGVQGRTWVAAGDPVGAPEAYPGLLRRFLERCDDYGGVPVFYEIGRQHLHLYADFGLTFVKLGEEAQVDLTAFTMEGPAAARYRQVIRRLEKDGGAFRVLTPAEVPGVLPELRHVSDDWLAAKASAEKGFSLGYFDDGYLSRFPVAVVEFGGRIQAFANIWAGPTKNELSIDLMRYHRDAPKSVMEALLVHVLKWAHEQGYRRFALGMAPLSGIEASPLGSMWSRVGGFLYQHGEKIYGFQGLRAYKEKFKPLWEPRYLAYPGGLRLPRILADISALIAGGYRNIFRK